jgi:predicted enzyme related to lactoylglutathione lyase
MTTTELPSAGSNTAVLNWVNVFVDNLDDLPAFYAGVFGLREVQAMRNDVFRGFTAGGTGLGFLAPDVYALLHLDELRDSQGAGFLLNFEAGSPEDVERLIAAATAAGAVLVKEPYETGYGWYQAVLTDPEGNVFRINHILRPLAAEPA